MKKNNCLLLYILILGSSFLSAGNITVCKAQENSVVNSRNANDQWFPYFDFDAAVFKHAPRQFGPFTRWWWPGNDVDSEELQREIKLFADNGFAGVEIQPLTMGTNPNAASEQLKRIYSWDSPSFYAHVKAVMEQAKTSGVTVDMNGGSGWPLGGPYVKPVEGMLTLTYDDTIVAGGQTIACTIPKHLPDYSNIVIFETHLYGKVDQSLASLQAITAAKIIKKDGEQVYFDPASVIQLTPSNGIINFTAPAGNDWMIIAYWAIPDGQVPTVIASKDPGLVANHFDSVQVIKSYEHLFGAGTGLSPYYGEPFRAVFNDSYEFRSDRHYADNFISFFKQQRGYDITPWLGVNLQRGYNNNAGAFIYPGAKPPFVFSPEDERIRYDYDLTVGELLQQQFIHSSDNWMQAKGMLHRTQAYGVKTDVIASSGSADIPEAEQLFAGGSEGFIKLITSGAHLYNRPVITQESFVFLNRPDMTTPQKIKTLSDKAFTCGINQIIYSGSSYKYMTADYGKEGWDTWSSPYSGFAFSSNENESFEYWKYIKDINSYMARCQYALRSGKPKTDVLIYFPFADFTQEDMLANPAETLTNGYFESFEPAMGEGGERDTSILSAKQKWFYKAWKVINVLNARGITWEWINDASLQTSIADKGNINIRGNRYSALLLINAPYIQEKTANQIAWLTKKGIRLLIAGAAPEKQPGYLNYTASDLATKQFINESLQHESSSVLNDQVALNKWIDGLTQEIQFNAAYPFTRSIERIMKDSSRLRFIWNQSGDWQTITITVAASLSNPYTLNTETGTVSRQEAGTFSCVLPPYGSCIVYASKNKVTSKTISNGMQEGNNAKEVCRIEKWNIQAGMAKVQNSALFDWRDNEAFKYQAAEGIYTASFDLDLLKGKKYFIDAGKAYFTMELSINGRYAGKRLFEPYELEITPFLKEGKNTVVIKTIPLRRNQFIYQANAGNAYYAQFKGMDNALMPAGLAGPVKIMMQ